MIKFIFVMIILIHIHTGIIKQKNKQSYNNQPINQPTNQPTNPTQPTINFIRGCDE
jgi:hypothetical protein